MKNRFWKVVLIGFLVFIFLSLPIRFYVRKSPIHKYKTESDIAKCKREKLFSNMYNLTQDEAFPAVDLSSNEIMRYTEENFVLVNYKFNKNQNVSFTIGLPKNWMASTDKENPIDPFDLTNDRSVVLIEIENEKSSIKGRVEVFNFTLELNASDVNEFIAAKALGLELVKVKTEPFLDGNVNDILLYNPLNQEITRIKTYKNSSLFYTITLTFDNFYNYLKYAKDVSIVFNSLNLTNRIKTGSPIEFDLLRTKTFDILYPKGWKIQSNYNENKKQTELIILPKDDTMSVFIVRTFEKVNESSKDLADNFLKELKMRGFKFDGKDINNTVYDEKTDSYAFKLLNFIDQDAKSAEAFIRIITKDNKRILIAALTSHLENEAFFLNREVLRLLDIFTGSVAATFFEDIKLENTSWIKLINNNPNKNI